VRDPAGATARVFRFLVHDMDEDRGSLIALRARAGGHIVALETAMDGVRHRLLTDRWDAIALEVLAGPVSSPFAVRDLASAMRRHGGRMPPAVIYVRDALSAERGAIDALLDELVPSLDRVHGQDPDRVVRALERAASGRAPAAVPIRPDVRATGVAGRPLAPQPEVAGPAGPAASVAAGVAGVASGVPASPALASPSSPASPASNWRR
jgi:hypothetical protein